MNIFDNINKIKIIPEKYLKKLKNLKINYINDLLNFKPINYKNIIKRNINEIKFFLKEGLIEIKIITYPKIYFYKKKRMIFQAINKNNILNICFFHSFYLKNIFFIGKKILIYGKFSKEYNTFIVEFILDFILPNINNIPIYKFFNNKKFYFFFLNLIYKIFKILNLKIINILSKEILLKYKLLNKKDAYFNFHFPENKKKLILAKKSIIFEKFLIFHLKCIYNKRFLINNKNKLNIRYDINLLKKFIKQIPFELNFEQKIVVNEICKDFKSKFNMYRLLQGEVGSGKTIIAIISLYIIVLAGFQGAIMVPNEILAYQHFENFKKIYKNFNIKIELLTSSTKKKDRKKIILNLFLKKIDIIIGTHSLIQKDIIFKKLGLIIIDEQHKFGVLQRKLFKKKCINTNVLLMTATPIPRTLLIVKLKKISLSILKNKIFNKYNITTLVLNLDKLKLILKWLKLYLNNNKKKNVYIVCPFVKKIKNNKFDNIFDVFKYIKKYFKNSFNINILYSDMKNDIKKDIINKFKNNKIRILIVTTLIEIGIDIENVTVMLIMNSENFGLSQLHQLRGRIGRNNSKSYCILFYSIYNTKTLKRLKIISKINNGFFLSIKDLELRGPGKIYDKYQSGKLGIFERNIILNFNIFKLSEIEAYKINKLFKQWWLKSKYKYYFYNK